MVPAGLVEFSTRVGGERYSGFQHPAALALGFLALVSGERSQKAVVIAETAVFPQELAGHTVQEAGGLEGGDFGRLQKLYVHAGDALSAGERLQSFGGRGAH